MLGQEPPGPLPLQAPLTTFPGPTARATARLLAVGLLLGGCASADVAGLATQDDVLRLRSDLTALQRSVQQARPQPEGATPAVRSETERQLNQRLDGLTAALASLTARVDDLAARVDAAGRPSRPAPVTGRSPGAGTTAGTGGSTTAPGHAATPSAPAGGKQPAPSTAGPAPTPPPASGAAPSSSAPVVAMPVPVPAPARPTTGALQPQDLYQAAYIDFSKGSYVLAIDGFREFLRRYPDHAQANSAQYWIGEGYMALAQQAANAGQTERSTEALQRAVQEFRKVVANYPRGDRAPTALYKEALALIDLKQPAVAQARLQYLIDNFPQAEETPRARERLATLRQR